MMTCNVPPLPTNCVYVDTAVEHDTVNQRTTSIADLGSNDITLREAILATNATPGPDTIIIRGRGKTLQLESELPAITDELTIEGNGLTIDAGNDRRVLNFNTSSGNLTLQGLTLINGSTRGADNAERNGVFTAGNTENSGGAIRFASSGTLTLDNTRIHDSRTHGQGAVGGGVFALGDVVLTNGSRVSRNGTRGDDAAGGGIAAGNVTVNSSSFIYSNTTEGDSAPGGGIFATEAVDVTNATVFGNQTEGEFSTGGGIAADEVRLTGAFVGLNRTDGDASMGGGVFATSTVSASNYEPPNGRLRATTISNNRTEEQSSAGGGVFAPVVRLDNATVLGNRTVSRNSPGGGIYAVELTMENESTLSFNSTTGGTSDVGSIICTTFLDSLRQIGSAVSNHFGKTDFVELVPERQTNCDPESGSPGGGAHARQANISDSTISLNTTSNRKSSGGGLNVTDFLEMESSTVTNNSTQGGLSTGGGINANRVDVRNSDVVANSTEDSRGGGISVKLGTISDSRIASNRSGEGGGGISSRGLSERVSVSNSLIINNQAEGAGGGLEGANLTLTSSTVANNSSDLQGGGVAAHGELILKNSKITENAAQEQGGGISFGERTSFGTGSDDTLTIEDSLIEFNETTGDDAHGGGLYWEAGCGTITRSTFTTNKTKGDDSHGGGLQMFLPRRGCEQNILNTTIVNNSAVGDSSSGGGVSLKLYEFSSGSESGAGYGAVTIEHSTITNNSAIENGGGIYIRGEGAVKPVVLSSNIVLGNVAGEENGDEIFSRSSKEAGLLGLRTVEQEHNLVLLGENLIGRPSSEDESKPHPNAIVLSGDKGVHERAFSIADPEGVFERTSSRNGVVSGVSQPTNTILAGCKSTSFANRTKLSACEQSSTQIVELSTGENPAVDAVSLKGFTGNGAEFIELEEPLQLSEQGQTLTFWVRVPEVGTFDLEEGEPVGAILSNKGGSGDVMELSINASGRVELLWQEVGNQPVKFEVSKLQDTALREHGLDDLRDGRWHHIALIRDPNSSTNGAFELAIDGVDIFAGSLRGRSAGGVDFFANGSSSPSPSIRQATTFASNPRIGADLNGDSPFHGVIDNVAFFEGMLSLDQIKRVMSDVVDESEIEIARPDMNFPFNGTTVSVPDTDGRDLPREQDRLDIDNGGTVDIGAFESDHNVAEPRSLRVTITADLVANDGETSLREALAFANDPDAGLLGNGDADNDGFPIDLIKFEPGLNGETITTSRELTISSSVAIFGPGSDELTISGGTDFDDNHRVFQISDSNSDSLADVLIQGLTIRDGGNGSSAVAGAGIRNDENLTLFDVRIESNDAGAESGGGLAHAFGLLDVESSTFARNQAGGEGGGLFVSSGSGNISGSTVSNNLAGRIAGGAMLRGEVTLLNSTVSGNEAVNDGGGIFSTAKTIISNTTITGNRADIDSSGGQGGGGVGGNSSTLDLTNTIIAGNLAGGRPNDLQSADVAASHSLIGTATPFMGGVIDGVSGNIVGQGGTGSLPISSILNTELLDNGGRTKTHALVENSRAVNAGTERASNFDQRGFGFEGTKFGATDMGSIESGFDSERRSLMVTTVSDVVAEDGVTSLREAIEFANDPLTNLGTGDADGDGNPMDTIFFDPSLNGQTIELNRELAVTSSVKVAGPGANLMTIDGNEQNRIFRLGASDAATYVIEGLTLANGNAGVSDGGAILLFDLNDRLIVDGLQFLSNSSNNGGAVHVAGSDFVIRNSSFEDNHANLNGSAVFAFGDIDAFLSNSTVSGSRATSGTGSALFVQAGRTQEPNVRLRNMTVAFNRTGGLDGFQSQGGNTIVDIGNSIFSNNDALNVTRDISIVSSGSNISDDSSLGFSRTSDLNTDPLLGTLEKHGGTTLLFSLQSDSPAIDAGNNRLATTVANDSNSTLALATDQRGSAFSRRAALSQVDIGAFERAQESSSLVVTTTSDVVDRFDGSTSLREAIAFANGRRDADLDGDHRDVITFASGPGEAFENGGVIRLGSGRNEIAPNEALEFTITEALEIDGSSAPFVVITGDVNNDDTTIGQAVTDLNATSDEQLTDNRRLFNITSPNAQTTFVGVTLTGGRVTSECCALSANRERGGGIRSAGDVFLIDSQLSGNSTNVNTGHGGGIFSDGKVVLHKSTVSGNRTEGNAASGGGVFAGEVHAFSSTINGNILQNPNGSGRGGGIHVLSDGGQIVNSTIHGNLAFGQGATGMGVFSDRGSLSIVQSTITANRDETSNSSKGGGIAVSAIGSLALANSIVLGNEAEADTEIFALGELSLFGQNLIGESPAEFTPSSSSFNASVESTFERIDNGFGELRDNGGQVETVALRESSTNPAVNQSSNELLLDLDEAALGIDINLDGDTDDNIAQFSELQFDARGANFARSAGNQIDLGAFEVQRPLGVTGTIDSQRRVSVRGSDQVGIQIDLRSDEGLLVPLLPEDLAPFESIVANTPEHISLTSLPLTFGLVQTEILYLGNPEDLVATWTELDGTVKPFTFQQACLADGPRAISDVGECARNIEERDTILADLDLIAGDLDLDGTVGFTDFLALAQNFGKPGGYLDGDLDLNGQVEFVDFLQMTARFGASSQR